MHMKAGSILSAWLNFWIWIISFRIFGYVSLHPLRYDKTYLTIWIRVLRFDGLSRMLPAFICTNLHFNILPETPTSPFLPEILCEFGVFGVERPTTLTLRSTVQRKHLYAWFSSRQGNTSTWKVLSDWVPSPVS